ncbi:unnamed protein product [Caenorhabditis brenneri]
MSSGSPGSKAFCIGYEDETETSFIGSSSPSPSDPLASLFRNNEEQVPLILPRSRESTGGTSSEDDDVEAGNLVLPVLINTLYLIVDVVTVGADGFWKQVSRFGRYEVDTSGYDNHLGKAHVPSLPMKYFKNLLDLTRKSILLRKVTYDGLDNFKKFIEKEVKDLDFPHLGATINQMIDARVEYLQAEEKEQKKKKHASTPSFHATHVAPERNRMPRNLMSAPYNLTYIENEATNVTPARGIPKATSYFQRISNLMKGPAPAESHPLGPAYEKAQEVSMVVAGPVEGVEKVRLVAVRLNEAVSIELFPSIPKVREIFFIVGPPLVHDQSMYMNMGRALASIASNPTATRAFEKLKSQESLTEVVEQVISRGLFIPSGEIGNKHLVSPDLICKQLNDEALSMKKERSDKVQDKDVERQNKTSSEKGDEEDWSLFAGVRSDLRVRMGEYKSDWVDGLTAKIIPVAFYMFCVSVVPTLTFGAIMGEGTGMLLGVQECLLSQAFSGIIWLTTSCQSAIIVSPTGPFLVFEKALYEFCSNRSLEFLEVRFYTGFIVFFSTVLCSAFNGARLAKYITLFTEDIFCGLISFIFFFESYYFLRDQYLLNPIRNFDYYAAQVANCTGSSSECLIGHPNSFLLQFCMFVGSIFLFNYLRHLSTTSLFKRTMRNLLFNFGGIVPVIFFSAFQYFLFREIPVSMVHIPSVIGENRGPYGYLVVPKHVPTLMTIGTSLFVSVPIFLLIFLETEIPEQMAKRKLVKRSGQHWDLIVVGFIFLVCSIMGLPWMCPAAVQSLAHIDALTEYNPCKPGEPKTIKCIREQRMSGFLLYTMIGLYAIFGSHVPIPIATIMGIFCYIGIRNLEGSYILVRLLMMMTARKHRERFGILNDIPSTTSHVYTFFQCFCLVALLVIKMDQIGGICFPLSIVLLSFTRYKLLPLVFEREFLATLDKEFLSHNHQEEEEAEDFYANSRIPV